MGALFWMGDLPGILMIIVYGGVIACLSLIPSLNKFARTNIRSRLLLAALLSVSAFVLTMGLVTLRSAQAGLSYGLSPGSGLDVQALQENRSDVFRELWLREIVPPPLQKSCFSKQVFAEAGSETGALPGDAMVSAPDSVCGLADRIGSITTPAYIKSLAFYLLSALACSILTLMLTHEKQPPKPKGRRR